MTTAIFEILGLLIVSCLIGVFFTYRFWKGKMAVLKSEKSDLESENKKLSQEAERSKTENNNLTLEKQRVETDLAETQKENTELKRKVTKLEEENQNLKAAGKKEKPSPTAQKDHSNELKILSEKVETMEQALGEKERELEAVSFELEKKKISYYKQIDGKRYKAATILMADKAVEGKGDGRISQEDAKEIFDTISDGHQYTQVEKDTMHYLRENYNWTESADDLFRTKVRSWAAKGHELDDESK